MFLLEGVSKATFNICSASSVVVGLPIGVAEEAGSAVAAEAVIDAGRIRVFFLPVGGRPPKVGGRRLVPPTPGPIDDVDGPAPADLPATPSAAHDPASIAGRQLVPANPDMLDGPPAA